MCLSVTFVHSIQTAEDIVKLLYRPDSPIILVLRLDALAKALSVIATATWLAGWLGGCWLAGWVSVTLRYCIKTAKPIGKLFRPTESTIVLVF